MTVRSLVLVALAGALSFGHVRESHAITSCGVCVDEVHPCDFPCYLSSPTGDNRTRTSCKAAGYKCLRTQDVTSDELCRAPASTVAAADASEAMNASAAIEVVTLAAAWLRDGLAVVTGIVERVASRDSDAGVRLAHS